MLVDAIDDVCVCGALFVNGEQPCRNAIRVHAGHGGGGLERDRCSCRGAVSLGVDQGAFEVLLRGTLPAARGWVSVPLPRGGRGARGGRPAAQSAR